MKTKIFFEWFIKLMYSVIKLLYSTPVPWPFVIGEPHFCKMPMDKSESKDSGRAHAQPRQKTTA
jgi:hypothetical protein